MQTTHRLGRPISRCCWLVCPLTLVGLSYATPVKGQSLGSTGDFVISAERLFGLYSVRRELDDPGGYDTTGTSVGFLAQDSRQPLTTPRIGFDYFVSGPLSVGGVFAVYSYEEEDGPEDSGVLLSVRAGYAFPFTGEFGFWPRGGLTYFSEEGPGRDQWALTLEAPFYYLPLPHVGFTLAPILDLGFAGEQEGGQDRDYWVRVFGATASMLAVF